MSPPLDVMRVSTSADPDEPLRLGTTGDQRGGASEPIPVTQRPRAGGPLPASPAQEGVWLQDRLDLGGAHHLGLVLRLTGSVDAALPRRAIHAVVARHEVLHTRFGEEGGRPIQWLEPPRRPPLPVVDVTGLPQGSGNRAAGAVVEAVLRRPFDLAHPPDGSLLRAVLVRSGHRAGSAGAAGDHHLVLSLHEVVCDRSSLTILAREIGIHWQAAVEGRDPDPPALEIQYGDYAEWQAARLASPELEAGLKRCCDRLDGAPTELGLPVDHPRSTSCADRAERLSLPIAASLSDSLHRLARSEGTSVFPVLAAAVQVILGRWSGRDDLLLAAPVPNRPRPELEPLIGLFTTILVLRGRLGGDRTFRRVLARGHQELQSASADREVPFERIVGRLRPSRERGRMPLAQAALTSRSRPPGPTTAFGEQAVELSCLDPHESAFDLNFVFEERGDDTLTGVLEYRGGLFDGTTVLRMLRELRRLLELATEDPDRALADLDLVAPGERQAVLVEWNDTARQVPTPESLIPRFEGAAFRAPDAVALVEGSDHRTYGSLAHRVRALGRRLRDRGVSRGSPVGLLGDRSEEVITGALSILASGGAYVPMDPRAPVPRLQVIAQEVGLRHALVASGTEALAVELGLQGVPLEVSRREEDDGAAVEPEPVSAADLAYVMFTSGSTGRPKAVGATQRGVIRLVRRPSYANFGPGETLAQIAPLSFDASTVEIWGALLHGGRLVVAPPGPRSLAEIAGLVSRERVTLLLLTSGLFHQMVDAEGDALAGPRQLLVGGDVLSPRHAAKHLERVLPGSVLLHGYGPTEATTLTSCQGLKAGDYPGTPVPIGRSIPETRTVVADAALRLLPVGSQGELLVGGPGLARGYLRRPGATAAAFVPDPWPTGPGGAGGRLYRTGDFVRLLADGRLEFSGRIDRQLKVRGVRVEPGEVEFALEGHPGVADAVVVLDRRDTAGAGEDRLVAYWVPASAEGAPAASDLRRFLEARLPKALVPSLFVALETLPLTSEGKVDRRALIASGADAGSPAPWPGSLGAVGARVGELWSEVLGRPAELPEEDFFESGGTSFDATRLISAIHRTLEVDLPLRVLFEAPTLGALATAVRDARGAGATTDPPAGAARGAPLSFAQERLWFFDRLSGGGAAYNIPVAVTLSGRLHLSALAAVLRAIHSRHEVLRTRFVEWVATPAQVVADGEPLRVPLIDLGGLPEPTARGVVGRLAAEELWKGFDLERGPVWRVRVVRLGPSEHAVLVTMHHIVSDGWSTNVLVQEVAEGYRALTDGPGGSLEEVLPPLPVQYAEFARQQREELQGKRLDELLEHWRARLAGASAVLELPTDRPRPPVQSFRGGSVEFQLPAPLFSGLLGWARRRTVTPFMVLLAAFQLLLSRWTGQEDFLVGSPVANRPRAELERLVGLFVNTLALRSDLSDEPAFDELVARVRYELLDAYQHQELPFERLVEELAPRRELSRQPLVQVLFALQNAPATELHVSGVTLEALAGSGDPASRFDLEVNLVEVEGGVSGTFIFPRSLFDSTTVQRLAGHYRRLLEAIAADPERPVDELPLLSHAELHAVTCEWPESARRTGGATGSPRTVVDRRLRAAPAGVWGEVVTETGGGRTRGMTGERGRFRPDGTLEVSARTPGTGGDVTGPVVGADASSREPAAEFTPPRTPLEEALVEIWSDVLGRDGIGIHDDFFDLGGHSLLATQVVARLRDPLGYELALEAFFEAPTVAGLAERIVTSEVEEAEDEALDDVLAELDRLSEEEVELLLQGEERRESG